MSGKKSKRGGYLQYAALSMVGTQIVVSIFVGFGIGYWLDGLAGTLPLFMIIFGILGIASGFLNLYRTAKRYEKYDDKEG